MVRRRFEGTAGVTLRLADLVISACVLCIEVVSSVGSKGPGSKEQKHGAAWPGCSPVDVPFDLQARLARDPRCSRAC